MGYIDTLNNSQINNIYEIISQLDKCGITNEYSKMAILAVVSKESAFYPQRETSYRGTSNERIRKIFSKTSFLNDDELNKLKSNDVDFFNFVYGGMYGNSQYDGYKYRGGGFNQLTFKGNYDSVGKRIGVDLVNNPDKIKDISVAAKVLCDYFKKRFNEVGKNINDFKDKETALKRFFEANRGFGKGSIDVVGDVTGGYALAKSRIDDFEKIVKKKSKVNFVEISLISLVSLMFYYLLRNEVNGNYKYLLLLFLFIVSYLIINKTEIGGFIKKKVII